MARERRFPSITLSLNDRILTVLAVKHGFSLPKENISQAHTLQQDGTEFKPIHLNFAEDCKPQRSTIIFTISECLINSMVLTESAFTQIFIPNILY